MDRHVGRRREWKVIIMYKIVEGAKGKRYMKDGRFIKASDVPEEELKRLELNIPDTIEGDNKKCIFCGMYSNLPRTVNGRTIYLCNEHFYSETIGKIAQKIRENDHER